MLEFQFGAFGGVFGAGHCIGGLVAGLGRGYLKAVIDSHGDILAEWRFGHTGQGRCHEQGSEQMFHALVIFLRLMSR